MDPKDTATLISLSAGMTALLLYWFLVVRKYERNLAKDGTLLTWLVKRPAAFAKWFILSWLGILFSSVVYASVAVILRSIVK